MHQTLHRSLIIHATNVVDVTSVGGSGSGSSNRNRNSNNSGTSVSSTSTMDDKTLALKAWQQHATPHSKRYCSIIVDHFQSMHWTGHRSHVHTATINPQNSTYTPLYPWHSLVKQTQIQIQEGPYPLTHVCSTLLEKNSSMITMHDIAPLANNECELSRGFNCDLRLIYSCFLCGCLPNWCSFWRFWLCWNRR